MYKKKILILTHCGVSFLKLNDVCHKIMYFANSCKLVTHKDKIFFHHEFIILYIHTN